MTPPRLESSRFPYLPVTVVIDGRETDLEALLDTGFDGGLAVPEDVMSGQAPDSYLDLYLADGSLVHPPAWEGILRLDRFDPFPVTVVAIGAETIVGRHVASRFGIFLDHGNRIIVEP